MDEKNTRSDSTKDKHEFLLRIDGIVLDQETIQRISKSLQRAFLHELAGLDIKVGVGVRFGGNGGTDGVSVVARSEGGPIR